MKMRFTEEQIIGFLREAEAGLPTKVSRPSFCRHQTTASGLPPLR